MAVARKRGGASNRKASFDINVEEKYEAGIVLTGDEIKSIRAGRLQLQGGYVKVMRGRTGDKLPEVVVVGMHLSQAAVPERSRKLLLHKKEIEAIDRSLSAKGRTAVPLELHFKGGWAKLTIGVGQGRRHYDKRELIKARDIERDQRRDLKGLK